MLILVVSAFGPRRLLVIPQGMMIIIIIIIIIIIQYLYGALKSCKGYGGAGGFRLRLSERVCFEVFLKVCKV